MSKTIKMIGLFLAVMFVMSLSAIAVSAHQEAVRIWEPAHWEPAHKVAAEFDEDGDYIPAHWVKAGSG